MTGSGGGLGLSSENEALLLLVPSVGLGGGIERYVAAVSEAVVSRGVSVRQEALSIPTHVRGRRGKAGFVLRALRSSLRLRRAGGMVHVVAAHPSFLTVGLLCRAVAGASSCHVIFYGIDIWDASRITRFLTRRLSIVHPVCISSFGSGAVSPFGVASVLRPGLTRHWFETLVTARDKGGARHIPILTVLRLEDWRTKGVPELLQAAGALPAELETKTVLVIAGQGPVPGELERVVRTAAHAQIVESPTDDELATLYASSKVMALATRTRTRGELTGEGFGMVLAEAQVAGCPVVAPVHGGSHDAYVDGFTGVRPQDESVGALVDALRSVLSDAQRWEELSEAAVRWGRTTFAPDRYEAISYATFCRPSRS